MDTQEADLLFRIVDEDGTGTIDVDEFMSGCMMLRGPATGFNIAQMRCEQSRMQRQICKHSQLTFASLSQLTKTCEEFSRKPHKVSDTVQPQKVDETVQKPAGFSL